MEQEPDAGNGSSAQKLAKDCRGAKEALGSPEESGQVTKNAIWSRVVTTTTQSAFPSCPELDFRQLQN